MFPDCVPDPGNFDADSGMARLAQRLRKALQDASPSSPNKPPPNYDLVQSKVSLQALGLQLGDKIVVSGAKVHTDVLQLDERVSESKDC